MPELAEVETVRNVLKKDILNKKIKSINVIYPKMIENNINDFCDILKDNYFIDIKRKGKYLIFELNDFYLISHLRMEGKYFLKNKDEIIDKHEHVIFNFDDFSLRYHDVRKFGRMHLITKNELDSYFKNVGPDANSNIDFEYLKNKLNKQKPIKTLLLDQSIIAGLGNIYVDEVLYECKINPTSKGSSLKDENISNIIKYSKIILDKAIENKGTTIRSYTSSLNVKGNYQNYLKVHTKTKCVCGNAITKIKVNGRSTYYCNKCQKQID